jgi:PAS domain S-box-containing protein
MVKSDGDVFWANLVATKPQTVDGESMCRVVVTDITKRKQAEIESQESRRFLESLLEAIPIPVFYKDQDGRYLGFNKAFEVLYGKSKEKLIGKTVFDINPPDQARIFHEKDSVLFQKPGQQKYESKMADANGVLRDVIFHKATTHNAEGKVTGLIGAISDITEHKAAEMDREKMQMQLTQSQKVEAIGRLAGGVAHDFNNMLCIILGYGENLMQKLPSESVLYKDAREIVEAGRRSAELTRQLLVFSRKQILKQVVLNINQLIMNLDKMLRRLIGEDIDLRLQLSEQIHHVLADPGQIEQVVMNLALNARDAMPQGGKLTIETGIVTLDEAEVDFYDAAQAGPYMVLTISDTGIGMDPETQSHIFEPFFTTKEQGKGTGLGLSTVYGIVKQSGGNIRVESKMGQGTRFKVYLPALAGQSEALSCADQPQLELGNGEHILVVEDEAALRNLTERILTGLGYRVSLAANGQEAIDFLHNEDVWPDLIISDVIMPGMDGPRMAEQLKQEKTDVKVLFMSGYTDNNVLNQKILAVGIPYLQKPFNTVALAEIVAQTLRGPQP